MTKAKVGFFIIFVLAAWRSIGQVDDNFNVLLIVVDDLNDWTGPGGGHPQTLTPNLNDFAQGAITFTNGHANSPVCNPSRVSFLSGLKANTSGIFFNGSSSHTNHSSQDLRDAPALSTVKTMPQYFGEWGYHTVAMGKIFHDPNSDTENWNQWQRTFGNYGTPEFEDGKLANGLDLGLVSRNLDWAGTDIEKEETLDFLTADWIASRIPTMEPSFFVAAGIFKPHLKWYLPNEYFEKFDLEEIQLPSIRLDDLEDIIKPFPRNGGPDFPTIDSLGLKPDVVRGYLASVNYADDALGMILDGLESSQYNDNTIVVVIGDHGWHLGEKLRYKKSTLWEEGTKTTFMIRIPGHPQSGQKIDVPVSLIDIYPTLLELCNLPPNSNLDGESLLGLIDNPEIYQDHLVHTTIGPEDHSIRTKNWRLIRYRTGTLELYNHEQDSLEHFNLADNPEYSNVLERLTISLDSVLLKDERPIQYPIAHHYLPGVLEFERYDSGGEGLALHDSDEINDGDGLIYDGDGYRFDGADIFPSDDSGGGFYVRMSDQEWLEYTVKNENLEAISWAIRYRSNEISTSELTLYVNDELFETLALTGNTDSWVSVESEIWPFEYQQDSVVFRFELEGVDVDLNSVTFEREEALHVEPPERVTLKENVVYSEPIITIETSNSNGEELGFAILDEVPFKINEEGQIETKSTLDFEQQSEHVFEVVVTGGNFRVIVEVEVEVADINEPFSINDFSIDVIENSEFAVLDTLTYSDPENEDLEFFQLDENVPFEIGESGVMYLFGTIDFEDQQLYSSEVVGWDGENYDTITVSLQVLDENEKPELEDLELEVIENTSIQVLDTLQYMDPEGQEVTFNLLDVAVPLSVDESGVVSLSAAIDFEDQQSYTSQVVVWDGIHYDTATVSLQVLDENEKPELEDLELEVIENTSIQVLDTLQYMDPEGQEVTFNLLDVAVPLSVDESGVVSLSAAIDFEDQQSYTSQVVVWDGIHYDTATVSLQVLDENEKPELEDLELEVIENTSIQVLDTLQYMDPEGQEVTFNLLDVAVPLSVDESGVVSLSTAIDFEGRQSYTSQVVVWDGIHYDTATVRLQVLDENEKPELEDLELEVIENTSIQVLDTLRYIDPEGQEVTFNLLDVAVPLSVDESGVVSLSTAIDFEGQQSYTSQVVVWDGIHYDTATVSLQVLDENEKPELEDLELEVIENTSIQVLDTLEYMDPEGQELTFELLDVDGPISVNSGGIVTLEKVIDHEASDLFVTKVVGFDGLNRDTANIEVRILDQNEPPYDFKIQGAIDSVFTIMEWVDSASFELNLSASDPDGDDIVFSLESFNSVWEVDGATLYNKVLIDVENGIWALNLKASDGELFVAREVLIFSQIPKAVILSAISENPQVRVFPNPVHDQLQIEGLEFEAYEIIDFQGRVLFKGAPNSDGTIDTSYLSKGTYLLHLTDRKKSVIVKFLKAD